MADVRSTSPRSPGEHSLIGNFLRDQHLAEFKGSQPVSAFPPLLIWVTEALVKHLTAHFQHQERLLEETKRDLAETKRDMKAYKRALFSAERERHDLEERFEREKRALNEEVRQLRERDMRTYEEALNDGILRLKVRLFPPYPMQSRRRVF